MKTNLEEILEKGQRLLFLLFPVMLMLNDRGKNFCTILLILLVIGNVYIKKKIVFTFYEKFLLIFISAVFISIIFQEINSTRGLEHFIKHLRWLLYPTLLGQLVIEKKDLKLAFISMIVGIFGELLRFGNEVRIVKSWYSVSYRDFFLSSNFWNHRYFYNYTIPQVAMILGAIFIMLYYLIGIIENKKEKIYFIFLFILNTILLLSLQSRGMSVSLLSIILLLGLIRKEKFFKAVSISIVSLCIVVGTYFSNSHYIKRYSHILDNSNYGRIEVYKETFRIFKENNIITGIGFDNFIDIQDTTEYKIHSSYSHPHNMPLKMLSETGIIGFTSYYLFMGSILLFFWKEAKKNKYYLIGFLVTLTLLLYENIETMMIDKKALPFIFFIIAVGLNKKYIMSRGKTKC